MVETEDTWRPELATVEADGLGPASTDDLVFAELCASVWSWDDTSEERPGPLDSGESDGARQEL